MLARPRPFSGSPSSPPAPTPVPVSNSLEPMPAPSSPASSPAFFFEQPDATSAAARTTTRPMERMKPERMNLSPPNAPARSAAAAEGVATTRSLKLARRPRNGALDDGMTICFAGGYLGPLDGGPPMIRWSRSHPALALALLVVASVPTGAHEGHLAIPLGPN